MIYTIYYSDTTMSILNTKKITKYITIKTQETVLVRLPQATL